MSAAELFNMPMCDLLLFRTFPRMNSPNTRPYRCSGNVHPTSFLPTWYMRICTCTCSDVIIAAYNCGN